jgi:hypothetical protein
MTRPVLPWETGYASRPAGSGEMPGAHVRTRRSPTASTHRSARQSWNVTSATGRRPADHPAASRRASWRAWAIMRRRPTPRSPRREGRRRRTVWLPGRRTSPAAAGGVRGRSIRPSSSRGHRCPGPPGRHRRRGTPQRACHHRHRPPAASTVRTPAYRLADRPATRAAVRRPGSRRVPRRMASTSVVPPNRPRSVKVATVRSACLTHMTPSSIAGALDRGGVRLPWVRSWPAFVRALPGPVRRTGRCSGPGRWYPAGRHSARWPVAGGC